MLQESAINIKIRIEWKNKIEAINSLAIPTVQYSFSIIVWKYSELKKLDSKTRKILTMHGILHPNPMLTEFT